MNRLPDSITTSEKILFNATESSIVNRMILSTRVESVNMFKKTNKFIRSIHKLMNNKGIMYFQTPNILGLDNVALPYNKFRPLAHGIFPPMHLNAFSTQNITSFVIRAGFKLKNIETPGNFDVDIVKHFAKKNNFYSMLKNFKDKQTLKKIQFLIRELRASSHMAVTTYKN